MSDKTFSVLFLCTGNSARSIIAEAVLRKLGGDRFIAHSAGSFPKGQVHPGALRLLTQLEYPTDGLRSKSWDEFSGPDAPPIDLILTVCDNAAGEVCPVWPGHPATAHWGLDDPAAVESDEAAVEAAFHQTHQELHRRISLLVNLRTEGLGKLALKTHLQAIHVAG